MFRRLINKIEPNISKKTILKYDDNKSKEDEDSFEIDFLNIIKEITRRNTLSLLFIIS